MDTNEIVVMVLGGALGIALISIIGGFLHVRRERLLTHAERMKALELGREVPDSAAVARIKAAFGAPAPAAEDGGVWSPARKCFGVALWVPIGVAFVASHAHHGGAAYAMWAAAGAVAATALICGTVLSIRQPPTSARPESLATTAKPAVDPDAYDVAGRRG